MLNACSATRVCFQESEPFHRANAAGVACVSAATLEKSSHVQSQNLGHQTASQQCWLVLGEGRQVRMVIQKLQGKHALCIKSRKHSTTAAQSAPNAQQAMG
jgi:hypothetical protein